MGLVADQLTGLQLSPDRFDIPAGELAGLQVAALDERFGERIDRIKLLKHRADEAEVTRIATIGDAVNVLFPHTAYKSYPESYLIDERWDRLTKWLGTVSPHPIEGVDLDGVADLDDWIDRLFKADYYVSCSSGTTGKPAMLIASHADMEWSKVDTIASFCWGSGVEPSRDRVQVAVGTAAYVPRNAIIGAAQRDAFADPRHERFVYPIPRITVGSLTKMTVMRRRIADGTALPDEIADFERTSLERAEAIDAAAPVAAQYFIDNRDKKLMVSGMWNVLYQVARLVRDRGHGGADFNPDNTIYVAGGRKGAVLPPDYQDFVYDTFNIADERRFQAYSMQEINSGMPRCAGGRRYHVPPWLVPMVLDREGERLLPAEDGVTVGRAAFFDLSLDGRWGGVITGDSIELSTNPCPCGQRGPTIADNVERIKDLVGDDKIGCAGTVDAYVRGLS